MKKYSNNIKNILLNGQKNTKLNFKILFKSFPNIQLIKYSSFYKVKLLKKNFL